MVARARDVLAPHIREEDLGKAAIAVTLALLTVLAATVAGLQSHASTEAQRARREADRIGLIATGEDGSAVVRVGTAYGVYRRWFEQLERANWATDQLTRDPDRPDKTLLDTLSAVDSSTGAWIEHQTSLLQAPYYDRDTRISDFAAFEADRLNAPATRAAEQRRVEADVSAAWDAKASDYITVLTLLAVGLFFLGLGSTIGGRPRAFLTLAGTAFGVVSLGWTVAIMLGPIHRVPATAIERAVQSEAEQIRANGATRPGAVVTTAARQHYVNAVNTATDALTVDPTYITGYLMRATALLVYADTLIFSPEGPSQTTADLLRHAVEDYRVYVKGRPDDYAGWWNLGWAAYLQGDVPGSLEATNRALALAPTQFTLYLNRTLALLASRDRDAALADVRQAIDLAARDSTASAVWYLGQSDFNIGRLAELRPDHAATLLAIQTQLRESQVSLRALSQPSPRAGAPRLGAVAVTPVELGRYAGGEFTELEALTAGASFEAPEAVGFRVRVAGATALAGHIISARLWVDRQPRSDYAVDREIASDAPDELTLELVNPYGRAGFDLDAGAYQLQLFVDGATRYDLTWTVTPRPTEPRYQTTAKAFIDRFIGDGYTCDPPATEGTATKYICSITDADGTQLLVNATADADDRITTVVLGAITEEGGADVATAAPAFFNAVLRLLYPPDLAERAAAWIDEQGTAVDDIEIGGTTIRVFGADEHTRNLDIWSPWP
jgi:tetratricopeptide (TPR) repeat protein